MVWFVVFLAPTKGSGATFLPSFLPSFPFLPLPRRSDGSRPHSERMLSGSPAPSPTPAFVRSFGFRSSRCGKTRTRTTNTNIHTTMHAATVLYHRARLLATGRPETKPVTTGAGSFCRDAGSKPTSRCGRPKPRSVRCNWFVVVR